MKNVQQQELCRLIDEFRENNDNETFQRLVGGLFRCPLLFPMKEQDGKPMFLMAERGDLKVFPAFTDMEEAQKSPIEGVEYKTFTLEEYSQVVAKAQADNLGINLFSETNCMIKKSFFADVICPAFAENRILPALQSCETKEYVPVFKLPFMIGRSEQADMTIADNTINELHSVIIEKDRQYYIVDRDSLNGVYVNGKQVEQGEERQIHFDDIIEFSDKEYLFVPMGLAQREEPSRYGEDDRTMIANGMYVMQYRVLTNEFYHNTEEFLESITENQENFRGYYLMGLEMTCSIREKELNIEEPEVIERQRKRMLGKGIYIFQKGDYGVRKEESKGQQVYIAEFPELLHINELSKRMYFLINASGSKTVYAARIAEDQIRLVKMEEQGTEMDCGEAPKTPEEELSKVIELGI